MNSLATTMIEYKKQYGEEDERKESQNSVDGCKELYESEKEDGGFKDSVNSIGFNEFARNVSCIGNFVLVPAGFNGHRGIHPCLKDYWDLSLDCLKYNKDSWLLDEAGSVGKKKGTENRAFIRYINTFFLWDYVDEDYEVKPLFKSHKAKLGVEQPLSADDNVVPKEENEFKEFLSNVNEFIKRRGQFMIAMLKIALIDGKFQYEDKWTDWKVSGIYKKIMKEVFLVDKLYTGYKAVIDKISEVTRETEDAIIIEKILAEINSSE